MKAPITPRAFVLVTLAATRGGMSLAQLRDEHAKCYPESSIDPNTLRYALGLLKTEGLIARKQIVGTKAYSYDLVGDDGREAAKEVLDELLRLAVGD